MTLYIFRGLPACGKSTRAREMQWEKGGIVVERDEVRFMLYGTYHDPDLIDEKLVTEYQNTLIDASLQMGMNVYVSDMNLRASYVKRLVEKAWKFDQPWEIVDMTNVSHSVCIERDAFRKKKVGEDVISALYTKFIKGQPYPLPVNLTGAIRQGVKYESYVHLANAPKAIIVDIDGTVARMVNRGPFEEDKVIDDEPIDNVIKMVEHAAMNNVTIIFMSGRTDACEDDTRRWLMREMPWLEMDVWWELHMRRSVEDRGRPDDDVKYDLFRAHVADRFNVLYVIDDRDKVVKMWREIGLTCAQVAYGDF